MKVKGISLILVAVPIIFLMGMFSRAVVDVFVDMACNSECKAQLLYKNPVFYKVRGLIATAKKHSDAKVVFDKTKYPVEFLHKNGVDFLLCWILVNFSWLAV